MSRSQRLQKVERGNKVLILCRQCSLLGISRSSVYRERSDMESDLNEELMAHIDRQFLEMPYYGSRKMTAWLHKRKGIPLAESGFNA